MTVYTALRPLYAQQPQGQLSIIFCFLSHLSLNTHTHKCNIYRTVGSKERDMKAYHSYIGEVYTCQLSCNQNQQHSAYSEWLTRLQPFVLLPQLFIELNFKSFFFYFYKHKNKSHWYFQTNWIKRFTKSPWQQSHFVSHGLAKLHVILGTLAWLFRVKWPPMAASVLVISVNTIICSTLKYAKEKKIVVVLVSLLSLNHVGYQVRLWLHNQPKFFFQSDPWSSIYNLPIQPWKNIYNK